MNSIGTQQPLSGGGTRSVNFFNGRVLSGEDLSNEQAANLAEHRRLGQAIGEGIVSGLEVVLSPADKQKATPTLRVHAGVAINREGQTLILPGNTDVLLDNVPSTGTVSVFSASSSLPTSSSSPTDSGVYLLMLSPVREREGFALSNSARGEASSYNTLYFVDTVEFRLLPLGIDSDLLNDPDHLRNALAYLCFGFAEGNTQPFQLNPQGSLVRCYGLLDTYRPRKLANSDVPLALVYLTAANGITWIDQWSVRRRVTHPAPSDSWEDLLANHRQGEAEARFLQFQHHIMEMRGTLNATASSTNAQNPRTLPASNSFKYLPAAGYLPVGGKDGNGFQWPTFLDQLAPQFITLVDAGLLRSILQTSLYRDPIKVVAAGSKEALAPVDVYQDPAQPNWVLFARVSSNRLNVTVTAPGFKPEQLAVKLGPQTELTIPLTPSQPTAQQSDQGKPPLYMDIANVKEPALYQVRLTMVPRVKEIPSTRLPSMVQIDLSSDNTGVKTWLGNWSDWLNSLYPDQNVGGVPPVIYINPYFTPHVISDEPQAYAVFNTVAIPLLVNLPSRTLPLPVALSRSDIPGLGEDAAQNLTEFGFQSVNNIAGAWSHVVADASGLSLDYGRYLIGDAIKAVEHIRAHRLYYSGIDARTEEILQEMGIADDVALANADPAVLGPQIKSKSFAASLIEQARKIAPGTWELSTLGLKPEQITALAGLDIRSKGEFVLEADSSAGRDKIATLLKVPTQQVTDWHTAALTHLTSDSLRLAHITDLTLLPDMDASIANALALADIMTVDELAKANIAELAQTTRIPRKQLETLQNEAASASRESLDVLKLASITKEMAEALDNLKINTVAVLFQQTEEHIASAFSGPIHVARAILEGIHAAFSGRPGPLQ
ncbi:MAG: helix-hairpin-helix domain-containing protein [Ktedonobacteraceae bacterium]